MKIIWAPNGALFFVRKVNRREFSGIPNPRREREIINKFKLTLVSWENMVYYVCVRTNLKLTQAASRSQKHLNSEIILISLEGRKAELRG